MAKITYYRTSLAFLRIAAEQSRIAVKRAFQVNWDCPAAGRRTLRAAGGGTRRCSHGITLAMTPLLSAAVRGCPSCRQYQSAGVRCAEEIPATFGKVLSMPEQGQS